MRALAAAVVLLAAVPLGAAAQTADPESTPNASQVGRGRVRFVADPPVVLGGRPVAPRTDGLALACDPAGCTLRPAVRVVPDPASCGRDERRPRFAWALTDGSAAQRVVLVMAADAAGAGFRVGPVATTYSGPGPLPHTAGSDGIAVRIGDTGGPLILRTFVAQSATTDDRDAPPLFSRQIELVQGDRRQVLGALGLPTDAGAIGAPPDGLLRWAGDLDRDGRPDLLLAMDADAAVFMLFLSSLATPDEFVGEAGVFVRPDVP